MNITQILQDIINPINAIFIIAIIITFFVCLFWKKDKNLVTMIGILGTFVGIVLALQWLDTKNITESVPNLLNGLKTAFYTSIFWAFFAILLHFLQKKEDTQDEVDFLKNIENSQKNTEKWLEKLVNIEEWKTDNYKRILEEMEKLSKNIGGESDASLLTQIQKLRNDTNDSFKNLNHTIVNKQDELIQQFENFATKIGDASMEQMIQAVEKVMEDFNTKINDQLGQSFHDLKWAIDNLLVWQGEYSENIIKQTKWLELANENLKTSVESIGNITEKSEKFVKITQKFDEGMDNLDSSLGIFKSGIAEFENVAKNQKVASEAIIESIDALKNNFVNKAEVIVEESEKNIKNMKDSLKKQTEDMENFQKKILNHLSLKIEEQVDEYGKYFKNVQNTLKTNTEDFDDKMSEVWDIFKKGVTHFDENITKTMNYFSENLNKVSDNLQDEQKKMLQNLKNSIEQEMSEHKDFLEKYTKTQFDSLENTHKTLLGNFKEQTQENIENAQKEFARIHSDLANVVGKGINESQSLIHSMKNNMAEFDEKLSEIFEIHMKTSQDQYEKILQSIQQSMNNDMNRIEKMRQQLQDDFQEFDKNLEKELTQSLKTLWDGLTTLSGKFVADYGQLATKLEKLQQITR